MRSAPFGLAALGPHKAFDAAMRCAQITHGHPTGYLAAGAFAALIDSVLGGVELPIAVRDIIIRLTSLDGVAPIGDESAVSSFRKSNTNVTVALAGQASTGRTGDRRDTPVAEMQSDAHAIAKMLGRQPRPTLAP
jgi:ADP-ribosylglycohydrolase